MKRLLLFLVCALLLADACGTAEEENPFDFPPLDEMMPSVGTSDGYIRIDIDGQPVSLSFDSSAEYSSVIGDTVQASFYAYSDDSEVLYELYMVFPRSVQAGDTITPEYAMKNTPDCSVVLIISDRETEQYYFAGQVDGKVFPKASSYSINFDAVSDTEEGCVYSGALTADLGGMEREDTAPLATFSISSAPFSFTMPLAGASAEADLNPFSDEPYGTITPFDDVPAISPTPSPEAVRV